MKPDQYDRLLPFLHRKSARQRVILFLIAKGYTVGELVSMKLSEARALKLPAEFAAYRDEALNGRRSGPAFQYPNGKPMPHTAYYRLVRVTAEKVLGRPMSQEVFRAYINSSSKKE